MTKIKSKLDVLEKPYKVFRFGVRFWLVESTYYHCELSFYYRFLTALHVAADKSHYDVMDVLLKHGAKVRYLHCNSSIVLIKVIDKFAYYYLIFVSHKLLILILLQVNALDGLGQTALHRVSQQGNMQACRLLLQYGVDPSIVSLQGYTAAQLATDSVQKMLRGMY